jgi:hypothetical protein
MSLTVKVFGCRPHDGGAARTGRGGSCYKTIFTKYGPRNVNVCAPDIY